MAKYINVELFKTELEKGHYNGDITGANDVEKLLDEQPTADVKEVVRGKWIDGGVRKKCSVCQNSGNILSVYDTPNKDFSYCPFCGADMRGKQY